MSRKRGRPKKDISWPEEDFTSSDIKSQSTESLSDGLIHIKIQEALERKELVLVGKTNFPRKGRPRLIYRRS
tara:strand:+ start:297 stop:512 length:216 start_codon:yes stop_codon:yes gene_type:complete